MTAARVADPSELAVELGALVGVEFDTKGGPVVHTFRRPYPRLAYNAGGLLVAGGAYAVRRGELVHRGGRAPRRRAELAPKDLRAALARYTRDHWGQGGRANAVRLLAADPRRRSRALGWLVAVIYRTRKGRDIELTDYRHAFARPRPVLRHHEGGLVIAGGSYRVEPRGIVD